MALLFVFLIFTCKLTIIIYACADFANQEPRWCWGGETLNQLYCPNFSDMSQWTCFGGSSLGCACRTLYRAMDGECVEYNKCAEHSLGEVDIRNGIRKRRATNEASETAKRMADMPPNTLAVPVDSDYEVTKQLIQNEDVLELLMMSLDSYVNNDCLCIKSERFGVTTHGAKRSIDCYAYRKHIIVPHTIASLEGTDKLMKITRDVKITVRNTGDQTKVYLKPATRQTQECVIWGTRVDDKIEDNDCYNSSLSSCGVLSFALETRNTDPCHSYDEDDRRKTQKAQQEREIVI
ncbi:uncharacterized protein LOC142767657 isoform X2 [Rhipicephalus microplus]|uniref:uncharacterized protein LOC142767657 isoform X2 n=1 Tax=Rhipicephalus microplus TaxID=6941 RepID=UPI003F6C2CB9